MSDIEKEFNERFKNQELSNDDFDSEGLWDDITNDLDNVSTGTKPFILKNKWFGGMFLLLVIGGVLGVWYLQSEEVLSQKEVNNSAVTSNNKIEINQNEESSFSQSTRDKEPSLNLQIADKEIENTSKIIALQKEKSNLGKVENVTNSDVARIFISTNNNDKTSQLENITVFPNNTISKKESTKVTSPIHQKDENESSLSTSIPKLSSSPIDLSKPKQVSFLTSNISFLKLDEPTLSTEKLLANKLAKLNRKRNQSNRWMISAIGGINTVRFNFKSENYRDLVTLKVASEKEFIGTTYGINVGLLLKNRWMVNSGVEYHQLWSKLDYKNEENILVSKENQLLKVWIDSASGDTLNQIVDDTMVNAVAFRNVKHYNKYERISIPIEIGIQNNFNKFIYGISVGSVFNFTTTQTGKTFNHLNEIVVFDGESPAATYNYFDIGIRVSPLLGYKFSEKWSIAVRPQWMWNRRTDFDNTDMKIGVHQYNLNFRVGYFFK